MKVVDNWTWYYSTLFPVGEELAEREKAWLTFSFAPGVTIEATREEICPGPDSQRIGVTYRLEQQLEGFEENRWVEATAVYQRYEGVLVRPGSLPGAGDRSCWQTRGLCYLLPGGAGQDHRGRWWIAPMAG